ncbi:hypothetical protein ACFQY4_30440 [Catellatospora bangladeshensis]|uniref:Cell wall synthesis protein Wag31 n=1 Tax=Catellatospora bangladeshensis TaxID=310355 RepID=A0A8J3JYV2_9ACTN|nr:MULTISPECIES: hypothetical protein [Catellatospora]BCJ74399.1 hypothetical protein CS0771_39430 [Catellatospora sp. IY07-71]GIF86224.1 hypothetical protein Cba03nite_75730 [Catellatospora bangladeshensis]
MTPVSALGTQDAPDLRKRVPHTPESIVRHHLPDATGRRRGYDKEAVDRLRRTVAEDVDALNAYIVMQQAELDRVKRLGDRLGAADPAVRARQVAAEAVTLTARAQAQADTVIAAAQQQGRLIVETAEKQAANILEAARREADRAAASYRATAGVAYSAESERQARDVAMLATCLRSLEAARSNLPAIEAQFDAVILAFQHQLQHLHPQPE